MVPPVSDPLRSARIKLKRANLHASTAQREMFRFGKKHPSPTMHIENKSNVEAGAGDTVTLDLVLDRGFPDLPDSFAARFGDAIYNYRCALDHIAWQLVKHGSEPDPAEDRRVQFPIYSTQQDFRRNRASRLPGVDPRGPVDFIEARHGYVGGKATNETLLTLARLSNDDKHRSLHLMFTTPSHAKHTVTFEGCQPIGFVMPPERPKLVPDAVIATLTILVTTADFAVKVKPALLVYVALEDWSNVLQVLSEIRAEVEEILDAPEILRAL